MNTLVLISRSHRMSRMYPVSLASNRARSRASPCRERRSSVSMAGFVAIFASSVVHFNTPCSTTVVIHVDTPCSISVCMQAAT